MSTTSTPTQTETTNENNQPAAKGGIADPVKFTADINALVRKLATKADAWNTETSTDLFVSVVDEYYAQLADPNDFDAGDLRGFFARYANMNGVYNRLKSAKVITGKEAGSRVASDLI